MGLSEARRSSSPSRTSSSGGRNLSSYMASDYRDVDYRRIPTARQLTAAYDDRALALVRLVRETPSLQQQERINREHLRISVVNALATRLGLDSERDMRPQILATIAFAPLDAAMFSWFGNRSSEEVGHLLDEALRAFVQERDAMCAAISKTGKARAAAIT